MQLKKGCNFYEQQMINNFTTVMFDTVSLVLFFGGDK